MNEDDLFSTRIDLDQLHEALDTVRQEIHKIVVGQDDVIDLLLTAVPARGHALIEGVPGLGKTLLARVLARTISADFQRIQFTPDLMPSDILGTSVFNPQTTEFEFKPGPIFSNIILIDEVNRAPAKTQAALFEVMQEQQVSMDGQTHPLTSPFVVVATQNPLEYEGTYRLPEAQLDRFLYKIEIEYPALDDEIDILAKHHRGQSPDNLDVISAVLSGEAVIEHQETVRQVHIEEELMRYITEVVDATRNDAAVSVGGSPRASVAIMRSAKAFAVLQGRDFVTPDDLRNATVPVLTHRLILTPEQDLEGTRPCDVIERIMDQIEIPR